MTSAEPGQQTLQSSSSSGSGPGSGPGCEALENSSTLKKGLLWQQWDRLFSRWKERFFVLTRDYLACFKKGSTLGITEMGTFLFKVNLVEVEGLQWVDKKRDGVIAVRVAAEGQLLLWTPRGLDDWMFALRDAISRSKGRREALRKAHTLLAPGLSSANSAGFLRRHALTLQHTMSDSQVERSLLVGGSAAGFCRDFTGSLRSSNEHQPTPHLGKRGQRISVLTDIVIGSHHHHHLYQQQPLPTHGSDMLLDGGTLDSVASSSDLCLRGPHRGVPRLAPQCGSHTSLLSLASGQHPATTTPNGPKGGLPLGPPHHGQHVLNGGAATTGLFRASPRSLQVSPALTQRSLYAQHVLSAPEIAPSSSSNELRPSRSAATNVTSEFSFMRPDSPVQRHINTAPSSSRIYQRSHSCTNQGLSTPSHHAQTPPPLPPSNLPIESRPGSLYSSDKSSVQVQQQPPDVVPAGTYVRGPKESNYGALHRRRHYTHSKSDSSFVNPSVAGPGADVLPMAKGPLR